MFSGRNVWVSYRTKANDVQSYGANSKGDNITRYVVEVPLGEQVSSFPRIA